MRFSAVNWEKIGLYKKKTDIDRLGNQVRKGYEKTGDTTGRVIPWTFDEINAYGREVTEKKRKVSIPGRIDPVDYVKIRDVFYEVDSYEETQRFTILQVKAYGKHNA